MVRALGVPEEQAAEVPVAQSANLGAPVAGRRSQDEIVEGQPLVGPLSDLDASPKLL
jgi:hypothetical protein